MGPIIGMGAGAMPMPIMGAGAMPMLIAMGAGAIIAGAVTEDVMLPMVAARLRPASSGAES